jgi:NAD(P)-dependent dehydrogenase (short-subunit alcohol dehydrogenase family)
MEHDLHDFEGKVAIVTGGASAIGRAAIETLHQRGGLIGHPIK